MSITKQTTTTRAAAAIMYAHFGRPANVNKSRAAATRSDFAGAWDAIRAIESLLKGSGRKNQALMVIQSFSSDELDPRDPETPRVVADAGYALAKEVAPNSPCDVVVHLDSKGGNPHAHITIANVDLVSGKAARSGGLHHRFLKAANDKVMREMGLEVLQPHELAHDVNRARAQASAHGLEVGDLDKATWREFLADRVDEALQDPRCVDFDSLVLIARELGVSIVKKTSAKSEAEGRDPSVTYALVDEDGQVRRFGRSKGACIARKLGADYNWSALHKTIDALRGAEKEYKDGKSFGESRELGEAIARLGALERDRELARQTHRFARGYEQEVVARRAGGGESRAGVSHSHGSVEIIDPGFGELKLRLARERRERDEEEHQRAERAAERARRDRERQARREAERRADRERLAARSARDDVETQRQDDDYEFGF
ncbi:relaxase/mobilization nuclease domain-containing protein [Actinotignum sanguinis]|uniref:relaxase/mobilization nuclease domain-containing protein n=1 Tax=Actinotignum sanguinis TaxID=1445614 RepID=UPI00254A35DC|nr:relaxase/mobilization nuclease domain-containing protein [Actinotignum sanguinis]MDK8656359.1 relaxase/mobilization nuclease domain-containing protein [Actinotignum sanguinis]